MPPAWTCKSDPAPRLGTNASDPRPDPAMTGVAPVSLIIVSRHRLAALQRAVTAVRQLDHPLLELIVVADPAACAALAGLTAKIIAFDAANISAARNLGIAQAAGDIVLFLDDDAVPEPTWASRLAAPFADPQVMAATGFVRGRNGISFQWQASEVDSLAQDHPLQVPQGPSFHAGSPARAVKTQGTNCAFRRDVLAAAGGFDPAFRFYLDEADLNLRLAGRGLTAVVPLAQVHHGFAASARRRADRVPLSLHEIAASTAVFLRRHADAAGLAAGWQQLQQDQRRRLLRLMVEGRIEPGAVRPLLATLHQGWQEGRHRPVTVPPPIDSPAPPFLRLPDTGPRPGVVLAGRVWQARSLAKRAESALAERKIVTLFRFSPTILRHNHRFHPRGYWIQTGGLFGIAERTARPPVLGSFRHRLHVEVAKWAKLRPTSAISIVENLSQASHCDMPKTRD